jgi:hypothetical protein
MKFFIVALLLTIIAAALSAEQQLPSDVAANDFVDEYLEDALQQGSQEILAESKGEYQDDIASEDAATVRYAYSQREICSLEGAETIPSSMRSAASAP